MNEPMQKMIAGDYEGALAACDRALAANPRDLPALLLKQTLLFVHLRRYPEALAVGDTILGCCPAPDPKHLEQLAARAAILVKLGRVDEAIACGQWILHYAPHDPESHARMADVLWLAQRERDVVAAYDAGIRAFPREPSLYEKRGLFLMLRGQAADAVRTFDAALAFAPDVHGLWYNRGCACAHLGDVDGAVYSLGRAIQLRPSSRESARGDGDYAKIKDAPAFRALVGI